MKTIQTNEQIFENAKAFLRYIEPTKFLLIADPKTQTQQQYDVALANATLMNHWLAKNKNTEQGVDYSIDAIKAAYKALRDSGMLDFTYGTKPVINKTQMLTDDRGRPIRDLRQERRDAAQRATEEDQQPRRNLADEQRETEKRIAVNKGIEYLKNEIASFRGKSHSDTYKGREEMTAVLNGVINGRRHLYDVVMATDEIKAIGAKYWKD